MRGNRNSAYSMLASIFAALYSQTYLVQQLYGAAFILVPILKTRKVKTLGQ